MYEIENLTNGEKLMIFRRRMNQTQAEAARVAGVSRTKYSLCENDLDTDPALENIVLERLKPHEVMLLARRRAGLTQAEAAQRLGICRWCLVRIEQGKKTFANFEGYNNGSAS